MRPRESKTIRRGWRTTSGSRAVSCGSSASAVPTPTATASHSARQRWARRRLASPEIHLESPLPVATLPSRVMADLNSTHGWLVRAYLRNGWLSRRARSASSPSATTTSTPVVAQDAQTASGGVRAGIVGGHHDAADPGRADRVGARRCAPGVTARLQGDVHGRGIQVVVPGVADRLDLGVRGPGGPVIALTEDLLADGEHRADHRVGAHVAASVLGERDRAGQVQAVDLRNGHGHGCL